MKSIGEPVAALLALLLNAIPVLYSVATLVASFVASWKIKVRSGLTSVAIHPALRALAFSTAMIFGIAVLTRGGIGDKLGRGADELQR